MSLATFWGWFHERVAGAIWPQWQFPFMECEEQKRGGRKGREKRDFVFRVFVLYQIDQQV